MPKDKTLLISESDEFIDRRLEYHEDYETLRTKNKCISDNVDIEKTQTITVEDIVNKIRSMV